MRQNRHKPYGAYERFFKRPLDVLAALLAVALLWWLLLIVAALVRVKLGKPVIFVQNRVGRGEKVFQLCKFRTMTDARDENGGLLPDEQRITPFGRLLRKTSLDELPEIFNILKGDMSLIGPRPLMVGYLAYYTEEERHRHDVRPGLTGLAQVNGRSFIQWDEIFGYDLEYVNKITFAGDASIFVRTIIEVLKRDDVADVSTIELGADGKSYVRVGNQRYRIHQPLDVERGKTNAE